ncbi:MAG: glycosyltransferase family 4 protein [Balneolaceae bacterium]
MKILMVLERNFPPDIRVEHEIKTLINNGHQVVIASFDQRKAPLEEYWNNALICRKPISEFIYKTSVGCLKFPFYFNFWRSFIFKLFKEHDFDAIHIHDLPLAQIGLECKNRFGVKFVLDLHENWPALLEVSNHVKSFLGRILSSDTQWKKYEEKMVWAADEVIVVVEENKSRILNFSEQQKKIHIISNTPTIQDIENLVSSNSTSSSSEELILFYGGGVTEHRGLQFVLSTIAEIQTEHIKCWIVGDGSYLNSLKELCKKLNIENRVKFWGWKSLEEMMALMEKSQVLLIPHKKSNHTDTTIPHKLFQYMATGKPILATNCAPIERIIDATHTGFIYEFDNISMIKSQINTIYKKWNAKESIKTGGARFVIDKYNWGIDEKVLLDIYSD